MSEVATARRILIVDDNPQIHRDFDKIFEPRQSDAELVEAEAAFFGESVEFASRQDALESAEFELSHSMSGSEAVDAVATAMRDGAPFEIAFVDMRMPGEWDGLRTIEELWRIDEALHVVLCTAYSDLGVDDIATRFGQTDRLLFLKKPFDKVEASQIVAALAEKRRLTDAAHSHRAELESIVAERTAHLHEALRKSEAAMKAKAEFLSVMSHELKTPLNAIIGFSGILARSGPTSGFSDMHLDAVETVHRNGQQLLKLVTQVLEFVQLDTECGVEKRKCAPRDLLQNAATGSQREFDRRQIDFQVVVDEELPESVETDSTVVGKVLHQLLDNALKFTEMGGEVSLFAEVTPEGGVALGVRDNGSGIDAERLPTLFEAFEQLDGSHTRKPGGTGLGLSLANRLAKSIDAQLTVESELGVGTVVRLWLERTRAESVPPSAHEVQLAVGVLAHSEQLFSEAKSMVEGCGFQFAEYQWADCVSPTWVPHCQMLIVDVAGAKALSWLYQNHFDGPTIAILPDASSHWEQDIIEAGCVDHIARKDVSKTLPALLRFWAPLE